MSQESSLRLMSLSLKEKSRKENQRVETQIGTILFREATMSFSKCTVDSMEKQMHVDLTVQRKTLRIGLS